MNEFLATIDSEAEVLNLGLPDQFLDHGKAELMLAECGLDSTGITSTIVKKLG